MKPQERTRAILLSKVETSLRMVLVVLADAMTDDRETCWLRVETIAERAGLCERQARELLNSAEQRGLIRRWKGDHAARDIAIEWDALAQAEAPGSTRGGSRPAKTAAAPANAAGGVAKTAAAPANAAGAETGKDCHPDRQSLPPGPAKTAAGTGKDCPRSGSEAGIEAGIEAGSARVQVDDEPLDLTRIGIRPPDVRILSEYMDEAEELWTFTEEELSRFKGLGPPGALRIATACRRAGRPLPAVSVRAQPKGSRGPSGGAAAPAALAPFDFDDVTTWPSTFDGCRFETWPEEVRAGRVLIPLDYWQFVPTEFRHILRVPHG